MRMYPCVPGAVLAVLLVMMSSPAACFVPSGAGMLPVRASHTACARALRLRGSQRVRMAATEVTDANFRELVVESPVPTLVSFWAPWCGPCRMIKPVLEQVQEEYGEKLKLVQINTDENQETATEYGIRSIPTLMLFKDGERIDTIIGAVPKATLETKLAQKL